MDPAEYLRKLPLFAKLDAEEALDVLRHSRAVQFARDEALCRAGDPADCMYVLEQGVASVRAMDASGQMLEIAKLGAGEVIGELALLDGQPRNADVVALEPISAYRIDRAGFDAMRAGLHPAAFKMLKHIATSVSWRLREINVAVSTAITAAEDKQVQSVQARASRAARPSRASLAAGPPTAREAPPPPVQERESGLWRSLVNRVSLLGDK